MGIRMMRGRPHRTATGGPERCWRAHVRQVPYAVGFSGMVLGAFVGVDRDLFAVWSKIHIDATAVSGRMNRTALRRGCVVC